MTTTERPTAADMYERDGTFRELVDVWVRERRCPLVLVDRCLELDLPAAAECARWAATEPERPTYHDGLPPSWPYPWLLTNGDAKWTADENPSYHHRVPTNRVAWGTASGGVKFSKSILLAILWLLDSWTVPA